MHRESMSQTRFDSHTEGLIPINNVELHQCARYFKMGDIYFRNIAYPWYHEYFQLFKTHVLWLILTFGY